MIVVFGVLHYAFIGLLLVLVAFMLLMMRRHVD